MQQINVNLSIPVPTDKVLINKVELEDLKRKSLKGVYWNMKELELRTGKKNQWLKENLLYPSQFREVLDSKNGGFVYYPQAQGESWTFQANQMADFLENNFKEIFR
ncbi:DUF771 domain-containing protein [Oceanobacillus oncorhynchi]|uniref:DUF771 domain-containing protein n=1 Tax=Oceanobacillus oncorhynchi TaxID=545501 RepID=UPI001865A6DC|nr:DUF771 domain-containing protein [Oceanobacillus oncorhynchi]